MFGVIMCFGAIPLLTFLRIVFTNRPHSTPLARRTQVALPSLVPVAPVLLVLAEASQRFVHSNRLDWVYMHVHIFVQSALWSNVIRAFQRSRDARSRDHGQRRRDRGVHLRYSRIHHALNTQVCTHDCRRSDVLPTTQPAWETARAAFHDPYPRGLANFFVAASFFYNIFDFQT